VFGVNEFDWLSHTLGRRSSLSRPTSLIVRHKWCVRRCKHANMVEDDRVLLPWVWGPSSKVQICRARSGNGNKSYMSCLLAKCTSAGPDLEEVDVPRCSCLLAISPLARAMVSRSHSYDLD